MKIEYLGKSSDTPIVAIIKDFYTPSELVAIWQELEFICNPTKLFSGEKTHSAIDKNNNNNIKSNLGIFLDEVYSLRALSNILTINRKIFTPSLVEDLKKLNKLFEYINVSNSDNTLVSYYGNGHSYFRHKDASVLTVLSYFYKEPKGFDGGNLILNDFDIEIPIENNMCIFMPGCYNHEVTEVKMNNDIDLMYGRYCMSQFLNIK